MLNFKENRGITLIALVVTVIVLIILAAVTINLLLGTNGIMTRAQQGTENYTQAEEDERELLEEVEDYISSVVGVDWNTALAKAEKHPEQVESTTIGVGTDGKAVNMDLWEYTLLTDGTYGLNTAATYNNQEIGGTNETDIKDKGYKGGYTEEGKIIGTIPEYIKTSTDGEYIPVTSLYHTFYEDSNLKVMPLLPSTTKSLWSSFIRCPNLSVVTPMPDTVIEMQSAFKGCTSLAIIPKLSKNLANMQTSFQDCTSLISIQTLPDNVTNMQGTFSRCISLTTMENLPKNVIIMVSTFNGCTSLTSVPTIPSTVTALQFAFQNCTSLSGVVRVNANVTGEIYYGNSEGFIDYRGCFRGVNNIILTGTCPVLEEILAEEKNMNPGTNITIQR